MFDTRCCWPSPPAGSLFMESLQAEMAKNPDLENLSPMDVSDDPPDILFGKRRKGYFKCPHLCRVWVLEALKKCRQRGEYFVCWEANGETYDGRYTLAHAFTLFYISLHEPAMSIVFDKRGALKSTSKIFVSIRRYGHPYMTLIYDNSHMLNHICALIWSPIYG